MQPGSLVVCEYSGPWVNTNTNRQTVDPPIPDIIYTVDGLETTKYNGKLYDLIYLVEKPGKGPYDIRVFRELQPPVDISIESLISETQTA